MNMQKKGGGGGGWQQPASSTMTKEKDGMEKKERGRGEERESGNITDGDGFDIISIL